MARLKWRLRANKLAFVPRWTTGRPANIWLLIVFHGLSPWLRNSPRRVHDSEPNDFEPAFGEERLPGDAGRNPRATANLITQNVERIFR
jgi:hypothetical protein